MTSNSNPNKLTVAMITMNEERAVAKVIHDIRQAAPEAEILVVDSSKDATPKIAEDLGARVIRQFPPCGYGPAMELALRRPAARSWSPSIATIPIPPRTSPGSPGW